MVKKYSKIIFFGIEWVNIKIFDGIIKILIELRDKQFSEKFNLFIFPRWKWLHFYQWKYYSKH